LLSDLSVSISYLITILYFIFSSKI